MTIEREWNVRMLKIIEKLVCKVRVTIFCRESWGGLGTITQHVNAPSRVKPNEFLVPDKILNTVT